MLTIKKLVTTCSTLLALSLLSNSATAITYGQVDESNTYSNVGVLVTKDPTTDEIAPFCTGTLISPTVFLTAAHCTEGFINEDQPSGLSAYVSFDKVLPWGDKTSKKTKLLEPVEMISNPAYQAISSNSGDLAVVILNVRDTRGITPASLPTLNQLSELSAQNGLDNSIFVPSGFGLQERVTSGGGSPEYTDLNPLPRMYAASTYQSLTQYNLFVNQNPALDNSGSCFGDSGGPLFLTINGKRTIVATTMSGDGVCQSLSTNNRTDTEEARSFIGQYVELP